MTFVSTSLKTKLASLNKASLHYLSQTRQNNLSKIFLWKRIISPILRTHWTNESLNSFWLVFLESKKNYHPRKQIILIIINKLKWSLFVTYYANLSGTFPKIARNKTALSITMSLIAGHYSQNLVRAEFGWTTDTYIAMIGSTSSIQKGIIQPK